MPAWAWKITCRCFSWMLQPSSGSNKQGRRRVCNVNWQAGGKRELPYTVVVWGLHTPRVIFYFFLGGGEMPVWLSHVNVVSFVRVESENHNSHVQCAHGLGPTEQPSWYLDRTSHNSWPRLMCVVTLFVKPLSLTHVSIIKPSLLLTCWSKFQIRYKDHRQIQSIA